MIIYTITYKYGIIDFEPSLLILKKIISKGPPLTRRII